MFPQDDFELLLRSCTDFMANKFNNNYHWFIVSVSVKLRIQAVSCYAPEKHKSP